MPMTTDSAILATIAYFDIFDFALTPEEIFSFLWKDKVELVDCYGSLHRLTNNQTLETKDSFYFLPGRSSTVRRRQESVMPTEERLRRAKFGARLISWLPFVRAVFVCNSVAAEMAGEKSDIDFFVVTGAGRLWLARFCTNIILKIFRLRTNAEHSAGHICLSFFASENNLNLAPWRVASDDVYLAIWLRQLYPLYDPGQKILRKIQTENAWVMEFLPNADFEMCNLFSSVIARSDEGTTKQSSRGILGNFLESQLKNFQWANLRPNIKEKAKAGGVDIVLNDGILKFHENDAPLGIREKWLAKCKSYASNF